MKKLMVAIGLSLILLLSGCATKWDSDMSQSFDQMASQYHKEQSIQIRAKAEAIQNLGKVECVDPNSADCKVSQALSSVLMSQAIASMEPQEFTMERPRTGVENWGALIQKTESIILGATTLGVVRYYSENPQSVNYNNKGDVVDSGNRTDSHVTRVGDGDGNMGGSANSQRDESTEDNSQQM